MKEWEHGDYYKGLYGECYKDFLANQRPVN